MLLLPKTLLKTKHQNLPKMQKPPLSSLALKIISAVQFLARQGLSFRGHYDDEGNINQLLKSASKVRR